MTNETQIMESMNGVLNLLSPLDFESRMAVIKGVEAIYTELGNDTNPLTSMLSAMGKGDPNSSDSSEEEPKEVPKLSTEQQMKQTLAQCIDALEPISNHDKRRVVDALLVLYSTTVQNLLIMHNVTIRS